MSGQPTAPVKEFRAGTIRAAIWENEREAEGRQIKRHSVRIDKRYLDRRTGEWRASDYFFADDLPRLRLVVEQAFEFITLHESEDV